MKHLFLSGFISLLVLFPQILFGANPDSLKKEIDFLSKNPEKRAELMSTYRELGKHYMSVQEPEEALKCMLTGLEIARIIRDNKSEFTFLHNIGLIYFYPLDDYYNSIQYLLKAKELSGLIDNPKQVAKNLTQMSEVYVSLGEYEKAMEYQFEALKIFEAEQDTAGLAYSYRNQGTIYWSQKSYQEALNSFERALRLGKYANEPGNLYTYTASVGAAYVELKEFDKAEKYIISSRRIADSIGHTYGVAYAEGVLGNIFKEKKDYPAAFQALENAVNLFESLGVKKEASSFKIQAAGLYTETGNPSKALSLLDEVEPVVESIHSLALKRDVYEERANAWDKMNMPVEAYKFFKQYIIFKDSLLDETKITQLAKLDHQYKLRQRENEIILQQKESESSNRQLFFILLGSGMLLLLAVLYMGYLRNKTLKVTNAILAGKNEEIRMQNERLESSNEELRQFAHVTSHDLREPLRSISSFTTLLKRRYHDKLDSQANEFIDYITSGVSRMDTLLSDLLAYSVVGIGKHEYSEVNINQIITSIIEALNRDKATQGARISIQNLPVITANKGQMIQLFQHLVDNSIKFRSSDRKPEIKISCVQTEEGYRFAVSDNGIGMDEAYKDKIFGLFLRLHNKKSQYKGTGIGLSICKKIVEQHKGRIWIESQLDLGTTVYFVLPPSPLESDIAKEQRPKRKKSSKKSVQVPT
ncbi:MAG: ATP-binding protein [Bacteroidia bacterium]|nr:ATP-binding protein [Bacteroidia bacterium]